MVYLLGEWITISFFDEAFAMMFLTLMIMQKKNKEFIYFLLITAGYLFYSHFFSENPNRIAQYMDCIQIAKPFLFFYFFYRNPLIFSKSQKKILRSSCIVASLLLFISYYNYGLYDGLIKHPFTLGISAFCFAILYYYLGEGLKKDINIILLILLIGLLSLRTKYILEFLLFIVAIFFVNKKIKINFKYILLSLATLGIGWFFAISKFRFYFVYADEAARFLLYKTMPLILMDYLPFGSGYASFATSASGVFYSPLYYKYGISSGYGMSPTNYSYISDTFFPVLAEFGIVGIVLFILFWKKRFAEFSASNDNIRNYRISLLIVSMVAIESVAGPVFVMSYNFIPMAVLGSICSRIYLENTNAKNVIFPEKSVDAFTK